MNKRLSNLVVRTEELKGAAYQVMLALAWNSDATNECTISISDLAAAAHLTKKSVIRALQLLTSPYGSIDLRSILTKTKHGIGVGIPNTYQVDLNLLRDLNRRRRLLPPTTDQAPSAGDIPTPGRGSTNNGEAGNAATLVERGEVLTLRDQINQRRTANSCLSGSLEATPLSKREVSISMRALAKQSAIAMIARVNGDKAIPWMIEQSSEKRPESLVSTRVADGLNSDMVGEAPVGRQACEGPVGGRGEQPLFPRKYSPKHGVGAETSPVGSYSAGILWPRR